MRRKAVGGRHSRRGQAYVRRVVGELILDHAARLVLCHHGVVVEAGSRGSCRFGRHLE